ncbi:MAG: hypothetical protein KatS3mg095_0564 [Candidatus Parcubacteria bacterium]|nr:MAG: hypothetical protein KatS3mg095_0564 [Candidatus Parcubacteria bacterium]
MKKIVNLFLIIFFLTTIVFASSEGVIDSNYKYAWGDYLGWVNFGCDYCNVKIFDDKLSGYIWSENFGWINLYPEFGGVRNDSEGNLSGYAWSENLGWLNFDNVKIDENGKFNGEIKSDYGKISFNCQYCDVRTTWRPKRTRENVVTQVINRVGGFFSAGGGLGAPVASKQGFSVVINNNEIYTYNRIVELTLDGGDFNTYQMAISNFSDFRDAKKEPYQKKKTWDLCQGITNCKTGKYTVYARFFTFGAKDLSVTSSVGASPVVFDDIFYLEKGESTLLPNIISKTSSINKGISNLVKKIMPVKPKEEVVLAKLSPTNNNIFKKDWQLLTYTKTSGNLIDFVAPNLTSEIRRLALSTKPKQESNFFAFLGLANILGLFLLPFKNLINFLIFLFAILLIIYSYKLIKKKSRIKDQTFLIINK